MNKLYTRFIAILAIGILTALSPLGIHAEEETEAADPILEILEADETIYDFDIPEDILKNLNTPLGSLKKPGTGKPPKKKHTPGKMDGYRVQVFSDGKNPNTLQTRAKARGNAIVAKFPKYRGQIYSYSSSPNWYTRVGNFKTQAEAAAALAELKRAFPSFAAEMRVVKSVITTIQ